MRARILWTLPRAPDLHPQENGAASSRGWFRLVEFSFRFRWLVALEWVFMLKGRLVGLRGRRRDDVEALFELTADAEHVALTHTWPFRPVSLAARHSEFDKRQSEPDPNSAFFTIQRLDDNAGAAVGSVGLQMIDMHNRNAHVGISLLPSVRGQGLGRDAIEVVCRFGFEIRALERLSLETLEINAPMRATATSCGFVEEGRLRSAIWYFGRYVDDVLYGLLVDQWRARTGPREPVG